MKSLLKEGQTPHGTTLDSNPCQSNRTVNEDKGPGHTHCTWTMSFPPLNLYMCNVFKSDVALCVDKTCFADYPTNTQP